jgi:serine protease
MRTTHSLCSLGFAVLSLLVGQAFAQSLAPTPAVQSLIVQLKPAAADTRESTQALSGLALEQRRQRSSERISTVVRDSRLGLQRHGEINAQHHMLRLNAPLQGQALEAAIQRLAQHPDVLSVEPDVRFKRKAVPNDTSYGTQWHLQSASQFAGALNATTAWDTTTGSAAVTVAVLDTGARFSHPDLAGRLLPGYDMISEVEYANDGNGRDADASDPGDWVSSSDISRNRALFSSCAIEDSSWHGTFIAGQISAATNNATGVAGVSWNGRILPMRISGKCGALLSDILDGMRWAAGLSVVGLPINPNPARIINLSFGGSSACTPSYQSVIDEVTAAGVLVVVAAGNESGPLTRPADCRNVLAVGAVQQNGLKTSYSNTGANMGLMAPGGSSAAQLFSTDNNGTQGPATDGYGFKQGTSFSAPLAAGVAALMLSVNPALTPAQLVAYLRETVRPHVSLAGAPTCLATGSGVCNCTTATCGPGLLDAQKAVQRALPNQSPQANITALSGSPQAGTAVRLDGQASLPSAGATLVSYQWSQLSGPAATLQNSTAAIATAVPSATGSYVFRLSVTDSLGRSNSKELAFSAVSTVTPTPTPTVVPTPPTPTPTAATPLPDPNASPAPAPTSSGGGGAAGWLWGSGLWLLAAWALARTKRTARASQRPR